MSKNYLRSLLSDAALADEQHTHRLDAALQNPLVDRIINDFPIIPAQFLDIISFPNIDSYVTENFLWQYWTKALVQDHLEATDITVIARLYQIAEFGCRKPWPLLPYNSIEELNEGFIYVEEAE